MVIAQVDVEKLRSERRTNSTYVNAQRNIKYSVLGGQFNIRNIDADPTENEREFVLEREVNPHPFIPTSSDMNASCEEIFNIQLMGLAKRIVHTHAKTVVVGISGGLDSTLPCSSASRHSIAEDGPPWHPGCYHARFRNH